MTTSRGKLAPYERDWFAEQATFCLATGVQPSEYERMTPAQIEVWAGVANKR